MAIYRLEMKIISRGKGGCVTRAAAYRAGERIRDGRTGDFHNYTYRDDVVHKEVLLPSQFSGRADMGWARDRATLWNRVEETDFRKARLGRHVLVVLPGELTAVQRVQLARRFGQELADRYLGAVDVAVHLPRSGSPDIGHHAHLMMTSRRVTPEGIGARTILELSGTELRARGLGPSKNELLLIRARWADVTNEGLREAGFDVRVDHRSFKARGIDREPGLVLPRAIFCIERRTGRPTSAGDALRARYRERVEARLKGPEELARVLQKQKEEGRQRCLERARQRAAQPKKIPYAARTKEELLQRRRERYRSDEARRQRMLAYRRQYRRDNAEAIKREALEAGPRVKLSPQQESAQRWLRWRERERVRAQERVQRPRRGRDPERAPVLTAEDSARNWLALRERQKQADLSQSAVERRSHERGLGKSVYEDDDEVFDRRKKRERNRDYDYGL
jgi:MobA/MobL family